MLHYAPKKIFYINMPLHISGQKHQNKSQTPFKPMITKFSHRPTIKGTIREHRSYSTVDGHRPFHSTVPTKPVHNSHNKMLSDINDHPEIVCDSCQCKIPNKVYLEDGAHHYVIYEDDLFDDDFYWSNRRPI